MAAPTLLILPAVDDGEAILAVSSGGGYDTRRVAASDLGGLEAQDLVLILPGQWVRIFETELPKAGRAQQMQMARFAKEDDIANNTDELHFALSNAQPPRMGIVDITLMDALMETLAGLKPKAAYADYDVLEGDKALRVIDRAVEPGIAGLDLDWTEEVLSKPTDQALADLFAAGLSEGQGLNLLQGTYRSRTDFNVPRVPAIRFAALAAAAFFMMFIWNGVQDRAALAQAQELRAQTASDYLAVTGERAPNNPGRIAVKSLQSGPVKSAGFLELSTILFSGLSEHQDIRVDQLRFNPDSDKLQLRLIYPNFDGAARVERSIAAAGGKLSTGGVREQNGMFVGEAALSLRDGS